MPCLPAVSGVRGACPPNMRPVVALARSILIEARRSGLPWLALGAVVLALGLAGCPAGDLAPRGPAYPRRAQSPEERQRSAIMAARQAGGIILLGAKSR